MVENFGIPISNDYFFVPLELDRNLRWEIEIFSRFGNEKAFGWDSL